MNDMNDIECPECGETNSIHPEDLPDCASEDMVVECDCGHEFKIGWSPKIELR